MSRTIPSSQYETNLWSTHVNIVRLAEPIRRCFRLRTQVFKIEGFVCKRFLLSLPLPPISFFGSCFISRAAKTENPVPRSFFAPKPNGNACYAGYPVNARLTSISCERSEVHGWRILPEKVPNQFMLSFSLLKKEKLSKLSTFCPRFARWTVLTRRPSFPRRPNTRQSGLAW